MKNYWVSWYGPVGNFELWSPWWVSGYREEVSESGDISETPVIVAAVQADNEQEAQDIILDAFDERPSNLEWRFIDECRDDWSPFSDRFPRGTWMYWPSLEKAAV